jgi:hypothetical protein
MCVGSVGAEGGIGAGGEVSARCNFSHRSIMVAVPSSYGRHKAPLPARKHTTISQHARQQVSIDKTRKSINISYKFASLRHTRWRIIEPDVRRLRWPCRQHRASAATTTAHKRRICLPSRPASSVCHAGHVWGLGS